MTSYRALERYDSVAVFGDLNENVTRNRITSVLRGVENLLKYEWEQEVKGVKTERMKIAELRAPEFSRAYPSQLKLLLVGSNKEVELMNNEVKNFKPLNVSIFKLNGSKDTNGNVKRCVDFALAHEESVAMITFPKEAMKAEQDLRAYLRSFNDASGVLGEPTGSETSPFGIFGHDEKLGATRRIIATVLIAFNKLELWLRYAHPNAFNYIQNKSTGIKNNAYGAKEKHVYD